MLIPSSRTNKYIRQLLKNHVAFVLVTRPHPTEPDKLQVIFTDRCIMLDVSARLIGALPYTEKTETTAYRFCWHDSEAVKQMNAQRVFELWDGYLAEQQCLPLLMTDRLEATEGRPLDFVLSVQAGYTEEVALRSRKHNAALRADGTVLIAKKYARLLGTDTADLTTCTFSLTRGEQIIMREPRDGKVLGVVMPIVKHSLGRSRSTAVAEAETVE